MSYGDGDEAIVSARVAEANLNGRGAGEIVAHEFFTTDDDRFGCFGLHIDADDKVAVLTVKFGSFLTFVFQLNKFLHHHAAAVREAVITDAVRQDGAVTAGAATREFDGGADRVAGSIVH